MTYLRFYEASFPAFRKRFLSPYPQLVKSAKVFRYIWGSSPPNINFSKEIERAKNLFISIFLSCLGCTFFCSIFVRLMSCSCFPYFFQNWIFVPKISNMRLTWSIIVHISTFEHVIHLLILLIWTLRIISILNISWLCNCCVLRICRLLWRGISWRKIGPNFGQSWRQRNGSSSGRMRRGGQGRGRRGLFAVNGLGWCTIFAHFLLPV